METVELLLTMDPKNRPTAVETQNMKFFESVDFETVGSSNPPFVPTVDDPHDTGYFKGNPNFQKLYILLKHIIYSSQRLARLEALQL